MLQLIHSENFKERAFLGDSMMERVHIAPNIWGENVGYLCGGGENTDHAKILTWGAKLIETDMKTGKSAGSSISLISDTISILPHIKGDVFIFLHPYLSFWTFLSGDSQLLIGCLFRLLLHHLIPRESLGNCCHLMQLLTLLLLHFFLRKLNISFWEGW